jgi:hypothetical protein
MSKDTKKMLHIHLDVLHARKIVSHKNDIFVLLGKTQNFGSRNNFITRPFLITFTHEIKNIGVP